MGHCKPGYFWWWACINFLRKCTFFSIFKWRKLQVLLKTNARTDLQLQRATLLGHPPQLPPHNHTLPTLEPSSSRHCLAWEDSPRPSSRSHLVTSHLAARLPSPQCTLTSLHCPSARLPSLHLSTLHPTTSPAGLLSPQHSSPHCPLSAPKHPSVGVPTTASDWYQGELSATFPQSTCTGVSR